VEENNVTLSLRILADGEEVKYDIVVKDAY
jgi:hypothetical protein